MKKLYYVFTLMMTFMTVAVFAQNINVSGIVNDDTGDPLTGVNVVVLGTSIGTTTDINGKYSFAVPTSTKYITFRYIGYKDEQRLVDGAKGNMVFNINMVKAELGINQVVVSASKRKERVLDAPASVSVLGTEKIENTIALSPVDHLKEVPGVDIMQTGLISSNVNIRGFNNIFSGAMLTMVDNRIARVPSLRVNAYQFIPTSNSDLERIEIIRGPGSALYGPNASDGVLHMFTRSPLDIEKDNEATVSLGMGERNVINPEVWLATKFSDKVGLKLSGGYLSGNDWEYYDPREPAKGSRIFFGRDVNGGGFVPDSMNVEDANGNTVQIADTGIFERDFEIKRFNFDAKLEIRPSEDWNITLSGGIAQANNIELTGLGAGQGIKWKGYYGQGQIRHKRLYFNYFMNGSDAGDTYLIPQISAGEQEPYAFKRLIDKSKLHGVNLQHSSSLANNSVDLIYGIDGLFTRPNTEGTINGRFDENDDINQVGAFLQAEYDATEKITLVGALRGDYQTPTDEFNISPRAALVYKHNTRHSARVTYNRAFSTPTSLNLFLDISNGQHPVHGFSVRGIGNPSGYEYTRGPNDVPLFTEFYGNGQFEFNDKAANANAFDAQMNILKAQFVAATGNNQADILFAGLLSGVTGDTGIIASVDHAGLDFAQLIGTSDFNGSKVDVNSLENAESVKSTITQTYEIGYKGLIEDKLSASIDVFYTQIQNFTSPLTNIVPYVAFDQDDLLGKISGQVAQNYALISQFVPSIKSLDSVNLLGVSGNFNGTAVDEILQYIAIANANVGIGNVAPKAGDPTQPAPGNDIMLTYVNLGDIDIAGLDLALSYKVNGHTNVFGAYSHVNKDRIPLAGAANGYIGLNAPKHKVNFGIDQMFDEYGVGYGATVRWQDGFPANSAIYIGQVRPATFVDIGAKWRPTFSPNTLISVDITNLLGYEHQRFPGTPKIGRMTMVRLQHTFKYNN